MAKNIFILILFLILVFSDALVFAENMPQTGSIVYTILSGNLYDDGGQNSAYSNNCDGFAIIRPAYPGQKVKLSGILSAEAGYDYLTIFEGEGTGGQILWGGSPHGEGNNCRTFAVPEIISSSGPLTVQFISNNSNNCSGFNLKVSSVGPIMTCSTMFYDTGGPDGDYSNTETYSISYCPEHEGAKIRANFSAFNVEAGRDWLNVYDGPDISSPILGTFDNNAPLHGFISASENNPGGCLTFQFHSDGSIFNSGWAAEINCINPCQVIEIGEIITDPPFYENDGFRYIDICTGDSITFTARGNYIQNNLNYTQSDETSVFIWNFGDGQIREGQTITHTYNDFRGYETTLTITDINGCYNYNPLDLRVRVSTSPEFNLSIEPDTVCSGNPLTLNVEVIPREAIMSSGSEVAGTTFLPDGTNVTYRSSLILRTFEEGRVITSTDDIRSINMNIEHSYLGDLSMKIICPNGQSCQLKGHTAVSGNDINIATPGSTEGGNIHLGWAPDPNSTTDQCYLTPGMGLNYSFVPGDTTSFGNNGPVSYVTYTDPCGTTQSWNQLNPGNYGSYENLNSLIGCPLNGTWELQITDHISLDNGYIFSWGIDFDPELYSVSWSYIPRIISGIWTGHNVTVNENPGTAIPEESGEQEYTFEVTDDFGCTYSISGSANIIPVIIPQFNDYGPYCQGEEPDSLPQLSVNNISGTWEPRFINTGTPGTFTYTFTPSVDECISVVEIQITIYENLTPYFDNYGPYCVGEDPVTLPDTSLNGVSGIWEPSVITTGVPGTYTYKFTENDGHCTDTILVEVEIIENTYPIFQQSGPYCVNDTPESLNTISDNGISGIWSPPFINTDTPGTTTYTFITDSVNCIIPYTMDIEVISPVMPHFSALGPFCIDEQAPDLSLISENGITGNWYPPEINTLNAGSSTYVFIPDTAFCISQPTMDITVNNLPVVTLELTDGSTELNCSDQFAEILASGGESYLWNGGDTPRDAQNIFRSPGIYTVSVTDINGCVNSSEVEITRSDEFTASWSSTGIKCYGETCTVTITASGGAPPYTGTGDFENITSGQHSFTVRDSNGCEIILHTFISEPEMLETNISATEIKCYGYPSVVTLNATGGTIPYSGTGTFENTLPGNYSYTVTDANGCETTAYIEISQPEILVADISATEILCSGETSVLIISARGGTMPYSGTGTFPDIYAGNYNFIVKDANSCESNSAITISEPEQFTANISATEILCNGDVSTITINASGGVLPYSGTGSFSNIQPGEYNYLITDSNGCESPVEINITEPEELIAGITVDEIHCNPHSLTVTISAGGGIAPYTGTGTFENITSGNHVFTVTDSNGCIDSVSIEISDIEDMTVDVVILNHVSCFGLSDANAYVNVSGGTGHYNYFWNTPDNSTTNRSNNISHGNWSVTVTDGNECEIIRSFTITQPEPLNFELDSEDIKCNDSNDGYIYLTDVEGGTSPYSFFINDNQASLPANVNAGTYNVVIKDANNCEGRETIIINDVEELQINLSGINVECGVSGGSVIADVRGGTLPYFYKWSNNDTSVNLYNVGAGRYSVTVTDSNNCISEQSVRITKSGNLDVEILKEQSISCYGIHDGIITANCNNGIGNMFYEWSDSQNIQTLENIATGEYSVTVTDEMGCIGTSSIFVRQPEALEVDHILKNVTCAGLSDGSIQIRVKGGEPPYNAVCNDSLMGSRFTGLKAGSYSISITDMNNCRIEKKYEISELDSIKLSYDLNNIKCYGDTNGGIEMSVEGGSGPYTFSILNGRNNKTGKIHNNLGAGHYYITAEDKNGCKVTRQVVIAEPEKLYTTYETVNPSCIESNDGSIEFTTKGGVPPYSYIINGNTNYGTSILSGLMEGMYRVEIYDSNNCSITLATINLNAEKKECLFIPNAFTPNGDGINDYWEVEGLEAYPDAVIHIYNKWGQEVFNGNYEERAWDGKYNDSYVPEGTFIYVIEVNNSKKYSGTISVLF